MFDQGGSLFGGPVLSEAEAAKEGLPAQVARSVDVNIAVPLALAAERSDFFSKDTILSEIGKGVLSGFITGAILL